MAPPEVQRHLITDWAQNYKWYLSHTGSQPKRRTKHIFKNSERMQNACYVLEKVLAKTWIGIFFNFNVYIFLFIVKNFLICSKM